MPLPITFPYFGLFETVLNVGVSGPGVVRSALARLGPAADLLADPHLREWIESSAAETIIVPHEEVGAGA